MKTFKKIRDRIANFPPQWYIVFVAAAHHAYAFWKLYR